MPSKRTWNYRVLAHKEGDAYSLMIHEVHYDELGQPDSYTKNGALVLGDNLSHLHIVLRQMEECIYKPILSVENWPQIHRR